MVNKYFTYTVAVMTEKWVYHLEEKLKSRYNVAHSQTGRKRIFKAFPVTSLRVNWWHRNDGYGVTQGRHVDE